MNHKKIYYPLLITLLLHALNTSLMAQNVPINTFILEANKHLLDQEYEKAFSVLSAFIPSNAKEEQYTHLLRGKLYFHQRKFQTAIKEFERLDGKKTRDKPILLARCFAELNNPKQTVENIISVATTHKYISPKILLKDTSLIKIQNSKEWKAFWKKEPFKSYEHDTDEAEYHFRFKRTQEATKIAESIIIKHRYSRAWQLYATIEARQGHKKNAENGFKNAIKYDRSNSNVLITYSQWLVQEKRFKDAEKLISQWIKKFPFTMELYSYYSISLYKNGKVDLADTYASLFQKYTPEREGLLYLTGQMFFELENFPEAMRYFSKCIQLNKKFEYFKARGKTYFESFSYKYAMRDFSMAVDLNPSDNELIYYQAEIFYKQKNTERACQYWQRAKRLGNHKALLRHNKHCAE